MKEKNKNDFAEFLRELRQSKNISLEKLSEATKIQIYQLEALESGCFEKLPPAIYRIGILKRIFKFLNIDENVISEEYKNDINFLAGDSFKSDSPPTNKRRYYFILTPVKLAIFSGVLLFALFFGYLWRQFDFLVGPPNLAVEPGRDLIVKDESILVNGKTDRGVDLTINSENVYVASNGSFEKNIQLAAGLNAIEIKAVNNLGKTTKIIRQIFRETQQ